MCIVIFGPVSIVRIKDGDAITADFLPGGEGMYAWQGASLISNNVRLVSGIGMDFDTCFYDWVERNSFNKDGLIVRTDYCNYCEVQLSDRETASSKSVYGPMAGNFYYAESILFPQQFLHFLHDATSVILCEKPEIVSLKALRSFRSGTTMTLCWIVPERMKLCCKEDFVRRLNLIDIYAINTATASAVLGTCDEKEMIDIMRKMGKPFYLMGKESAYLVSEDYCIGMAWEWRREEKELMNFLGCEYTAAAAAITLFMKGANPYECCKVGNFAFQCQGSQFGLIPDIGHVYSQIHNETKKGDVNYDNE